MKDTRFVHNTSLFEILVYHIHLISNQFVSNDVIQFYKLLKIFTIEMDSIFSPPLHCSSS